MIEFISNNVILTLFIGAVLGAIFSYFISKHFSELRELSFSNTIYKVFDKQLIQVYGLDIKKNNNVIKDLSVTEFLFWNTGNREIVNTDLTDDYITLCFDEPTKILTIEYECTDRLKKYLEIEVHNNQVQFKFKALKPAQGFYLRILHDSFELPKLNCEVKNLDKPTYKDFHSLKSSLTLKLEKIKWMLTLSLFIALFLIVVTSNEISSVKDGSAIFVNLFIIVFSAVYMLIMYGVMYLVPFLYNKRQAKKYEDIYRLVDSTNLTSIDL